MRTLMAIASFFILAISCGVAFCETIELRDGKVIVGKILEETDEYVVISKAGGGFIYSIAKDRILRIRSSTAEESETMKQSDRAAVSEVKKETGITGDEEKKRKELLRQYRLEAYEKEVELAKKARGRIKIEFSEGRHGVVDVLFNGKVTAPLLVDTGASSVVISRALAERLGIEKIDNLPEVAVRLADGSIEFNYQTKLKSVEVGHSKVKDVDTLISDRAPGPGVDGLLGMSYLRYFHVKLDSKENCLVLEKY